MHLSIHSKPPGFKVQLLTIPSENINSQGTIDKLLFGEQTLNTELPISDFKINDNTLIITPYSELKNNTLFHKT
mgnify:CR=1 FL=1